MQARRGLHARTRGHKDTQPHTREHTRRHTSAHAPGRERSHATRTRTRHTFSRQIQPVKTDDLRRKESVFSQIFPHFIGLIYTIHIISKTDAFLTENKQNLCTSVLAPAALQALQSAGAKPEIWPSAIKIIHFSQIFPHFVGLSYTIHIISKTDAFLTKNR